jgi:hypothetical protein
MKSEDYVPVFPITYSAAKRKALMEAYNRAAQLSATLGGDHSLNIIDVGNDEFSVTLEGEDRSHHILCQSDDLVSFVPWHEPPDNLVADITFKSGIVISVTIERLSDGSGSKMNFDQIDFFTPEAEDKFRARLRNKIHDLPKRAAPEP